MMQPDSSRSDNEKRLFLALILSTLVLLVSSPLVNYFAPPEPEPEILEEITEPSSPQPVAATPQLEEKPVAEPAVAPPPTGEGDVSGAERHFTVRNPDLELGFSTRGAVIESIRLPSYRDVPDDGPGFPASLALLWRWRRPRGEPLELLPQGEPGRLPQALAISSSQPELQALLEQAVYQVEGVSGTSLQAPAEIRFVYQGGPLRVERTVRVPASGYELEVDTRVLQRGRAVPAEISLGAGMGQPGVVPQADFASPGIAVGSGLSIERFYESGGTLNRSVPWLSDVALEGEITLSGADWIALDSQYFTRAMLGAPLDAVHLATHTWPGETDEETITLLSGSATEDGEGPLRVYFGPKRLEALRSVTPGLGELVDYGFFSFLVKPLLFMLKWIQSLIVNYGLAIIILTFLINVALVPIRYKQIVSMRKMSDLQPQLKAIQNRYKDVPRTDPKKQEMNKEVMALYEQHGVNPLGSCLPLLLQMPFLFAFYRMLWTSIELRGEPFLWIADLSRYDPTFVTPVLMGATMLAQQKMTPGSGDPAQQRMMMIMPVVFTALFLRVSSGLALYFLFSNVFGMLFQVMVQRMSPDLTPAAATPASTPKRNSRGRKAKGR